jgi:DnaJ homolog subfamily A member 2
LIHFINFVGEIKVIQGQGMPSYRHHDFGNLYIKFEVEFPTAEWATTVGADLIGGLKQYLPPPPAMAIPPNTHVDEAVLAAVDPMQQRRAELGTSGARANGAMDEDDDEGGPQGVQCASQ